MSELIQTTKWQNWEKKGVMNIDAYQMIFESIQATQDEDWYISKVSSIDSW